MRYLVHTAIVMRPVLKLLWLISSLLLLVLPCVTGTYLAIISHMTDKCFEHIRHKNE